MKKTRQIVITEEYDVCNFCENIVEKTSMQVIQCGKCYLENMKKSGIEVKEVLSLAK